MSAVSVLQVIAPFFPHPLESKVAEMGRKPIRCPPYNFHVQAFSAHPGEHFSHSPTHRRGHSVWTSLTQFGDQTSVVYLGKGRGWQTEHGGEKSGDDEGFER